MVKTNLKITMMAVAMACVSLTAACEKNVFDEGSKPDEEQPRPSNGASM